MKHLILSTLGRRAALCATSALLAGTSATAQVWTNHTAMNVARERLAVSVAPRNSTDYGIYAFGGTNGGLTVYDTVEMFNPSANSWTVRAPLPSKRHALAAATADDGVSEKVFVIGGSAGLAATTTNWAYDPLADTWDTTPAALPNPRYFLAAATGSDGRVYAFGGYYDVAPFYYGDVHGYDPVTDLWDNALPAMPTPRTKHTAVAACDGLIYVMGGYNAGGAVLGLDVFDPVAEAWLPLNPYTLTPWASIPGPRDLGCSAAVGRDGDIYLIGGDGYPVESGVADSFDPQTNTWTSENDQLLSRNSSAAAAIGSRVYSIGGWKKFGGVQSTTESLGALGLSPSCSGIVHAAPPGFNYCEATPNSVGVATGISGSGDPSIGQHDLQLRAAPVPPTPGLFFFGPNRIQVPFGDGYRCVGGQVFRLAPQVAQNGVLQADLLGAASTHAAHFTPGSEWNFQAWYRDPQAGQSGFNLSDGYSVTFLP